MLLLQPDDGAIPARHYLRSTPETVSWGYLPNAAARYLLLFSHGNAEDLGNDLPWLDDVRAAGFAVLAYDYRG